MPMRLCIIAVLTYLLVFSRYRGSHDRILIGYTTTCAICAYRH
jgi:hypothetical protein